MKVSLNTRLIVSLAGKTINKVRQLIGVLTARFCYMFNELREDITKIRNFDDFRSSFFNGGVLFQDICKTS